MKPTAIWTTALASLALAGCAEFLRDMEQGQTAEQPMPAGGEQVAQAPRIAVDETLVRDVQRELKAQGVDAGPVDGIWGPQTEQGIREFQQAQGMKATGHLDVATLGALGILDNASAGGSTSRGGSMFDRVDRNGDGSVSREEFDATLGAPRTGAGHSKDLVMRVQQQLNAKGFDAGAVDGTMGSATRRALENFQEAQGMKASGELDRRTLSALDIQTK